MKPERELFFSRETENENTPKYVALCQEDYIEGDDNLEVLLNLLKETELEGDVVVWKDDKVIAIVSNLRQITMYTPVIDEPVITPKKKPYRHKINRKYNVQNFNKTPK